VRSADITRPPAPLGWRASSIPTRRLRPDWAWRSPDRAPSRSSRRTNWQRPAILPKIAKRVKETSYQAPGTW